VPALLGVAFASHDVAAVDARAGIGDIRALAPLLTILECWRQWATFLEPKFEEALERAIPQFGPSAIRKLERLARRSPDLLPLVIRVLGNSTSERAVQILLQHLPQHFHRIVQRLCWMGDAARQHVLQIAVDPGRSEEDRSHAASSLIDSPGAFQDEASRILREMQAARACTPLQHRISFAITGCADTPIEDPIPHLTALLRHPSPRKRLDAVECLAQLDLGAAVPAITALAGDEHWEVRAVVARALANWEHPSEALESLRQDPDIIVRGYAKGWGTPVGLY